ncbi:hypothetical protein KIL84_021181 [Mauremys mutica]|uniref:Uncharacterized protein n=1 Tax=Mauremys mutica TaxID=74926 RepID=A0A9D3XBE9_9SAUR|nr:hypothetical protein KIL84_021181 [Mauremys mutica]
MLEKTHTYTHAQPRRRERRSHTRPGTDGRSQFGNFPPLQPGRPSGCPGSSEGRRQERRRCGGINPGGGHPNPTTPCVFQGRCPGAMACSPRGATDATRIFGRC